MPAKKKTTAKKTETAKAAPKTTAKKAVTTKTPAVEKAPAKKAAAKKTPATKAPLKTASVPKSLLSPEERYQRVQTEAYYIAEKNGFAGDDVMYWLLAEKKVSEQLA